MKVFQDIDPSQGRRVGGVLKGMRHNNWEGGMPTFVSLITYTDEGMKAIHDSPKRLALAKRYLKDLGGKMRQFYLTIGSYDAVIIYDLPDEAAAARFLLSVGRDRKVSTQTLMAFPERNYRQIIDALP